MLEAVYPGTFDPPTRGHLDVIERGAKIFEKLIVAVGHNPQKSPVFSVDERLEMLREEIAGLANVTVDTFEGLLVDYVRRVGARVILRGIRTLSDIEHEFQMALTNRVAGDVETVFVMASQEYAFIDSGLIKQVTRFGGDTSAFVSPGVACRLREKLSSK